MAAFKNQPKFNIGDGRYVRLCTDFVILEDEINQRAALLNKQKWKKLVKLIPQINFAVQYVKDQSKNVHVDYQKHLGGFWMVSINSKYYVRGHSRILQRKRRSCQTRFYGNRASFLRMVEITRFAGSDSSEETRPSI